MIITLCGSARFEEWYHAWNEALTFAGNTVFALTTYPSLKKGKKSWYTEEEKELLDDAHLRKIKHSEAIVVLNVFAYIGASTLREVRCARETGKRVYYLESWGKGKGVTKVTHTARYVEFASRYVDLPVKSPISTVVGNENKDLSASNLLGPSGKTRERLLKLAYRMVPWKGF